MYFNTSTCNVYRCTVAGTAEVAKWVYAGCLKGAAGAAGTNATTTAIATQTKAGLLSASDKKKLDGIATSATKNMITFATAAPSTLADGAIVMVYEE